MSDAIRNIVIAGGGLAGWYTAVRLGFAMRGRALSVKVVRAAPRDAVVDPLDVFCASTLSTLPVAHAELGIDERAFVRACDATFKLATEYRGFTDPADSYLLPFGEIGARLEAVGFHHFIGRLARGGHAFSMDDYSVPSVAARLGRFAHPNRDARSALSTYEYAWHLDVHPYTQGLRTLAGKMGVVAVDDDLVACEADGESIRSITLGDGTKLAADLFIDCTGARAVLANAVRSSFESWRHWLPCDAALVARLPAGDMPPFTRVQAFADGWQLQTPLRSGVETAFFFDSRAGVPKPAAFAGVSPRELRFENGVRREAWRGNCLAVGAAAGFVEPLASTGLRLVDGAVMRLIENFPDKSDLRLMAAEHNRLMGEIYERARDFVLLHYLLSTRAEPLWSTRAAPPPPTLARGLDLFRHRGRVAFDDDDLFEEAWWACACVGLGLRPDHFAVLAEQGSEQELQAQVAKIARVMRAAAEQLPPHRTYLERFLA